MIITNTCCPGRRSGRVQEEDHCPQAWGEAVGCNGSLCEARECCVIRNLRYRLSWLIEIVQQAEDFTRRPQVRQQDV
jgi:hypothetical protein